MTTLLYGGAFDPPHNGHVALAAAAERRFGDEVVVLVTADPGHKRVHARSSERLELAHAAFPARQVELDEHRFTIDMLRARAWGDPVLVVGADQLADFPRWKEPEAVLARARLAVGTRPGHTYDELNTVLAHLPADRVELFETAPVPVSSSDVRARVARGEPIADLVPPAVALLVEERHLYGNGRVEHPG